MLSIANRDLQLIKSMAAVCRGELSPDKLSPQSRYDIGSLIEDLEQQMDAKLEERKKLLAKSTIGTIGSLIYAISESRQG